jgi:hypothetical protein
LRRDTTAITGYAQADVISRRKIKYLKLQLYRVPDEWKNCAGALKAWPAYYTGFKAIVMPQTKLLILKHLAGDCGDAGAQFAQGLHIFSCNLVGYCGKSMGGYCWVMAC